MAKSVEGSGWTTDANTCSFNTLTSVKLMLAQPLTDHIRDALVGKKSSLEVLDVSKIIIHIVTLYIMK